MEQSCISAKLGTKLYISGIKRYTVTQSIEISNVYIIKYVKFTSMKSDKKICVCITAAYKIVEHHCGSY